jgi:hypothetical protein
MSFELKYALNKPEKNGSDCHTIIWINNWLQNFIVRWPLAHKHFIMFMKLIFEHQQVPNEVVFIMV